MVKVIFCLTPKDVRWVRAEAKLLGISMSEVVRRALAAEIFDREGHTPNVKTVRALRGSQRAVR